ncbi:undecaprenyl-diphosphatase [Psychrobacillus glaciei]|uniref:Undecaprenyl-diphosphatase n=1 Tax=Psychrobacillus glaciei TaxID=2283160 RepID=A0A5J6SK94_9BACI|nr:undecaprenyl-diphosphatase [Psychrobacillus glaciei]QFF97863.1 undecaprenyl-diphosphatase [Psychrobacillus glaciei]
MNFTIFQQINGWAGHSRLLDTIMITLSDSLPYIAVAIILYLWFVGNKQQGIEKRYTAIYAVFSSAIALCINAIIHFVYYHPRPFVTHHVHQLVPHTVDSSFVSDHAVLVFAIAWTFIMRNDRFKYPILIWAIVVGLSRIYVGVHYPADVIGSALLSFATSGIVTLFSMKLEPLVQLVFRLYNQLIKLKQLLPKH